MRNRLTPLLLAIAMTLISTGWVPSPPISASSGPPTYLQVDFLNSLHGAVTVDQFPGFAIATTTDGGQIWVTHSLPFSLEVTPSGSGQFNSFGGALTLITPHTIWLAGYTGKRCSQPPTRGSCSVAVYRSTDGGTHWRVMLALPHADSVDIVQTVSTRVGWVVTSHCHAISDGTPQCGYDQKIHETWNAGQTWSQIKWKIGMPVTQMLWHSSTSGWLAAGTPLNSSTCSSAIFRTTDGGSHWQRALSLKKECEPALGLSGHVAWVASTTRSACTTGGCPETVHVSGNAGKSWTSNSTSNTLGSAGFMRELFLGDSTQAFLTYALGTNLNTEGGIATSSDGGKSWTRAYPCYAIGSGGAYSPAAGTIWLAGAWVSYCSQSRETGLFETTNWGQDWKQVSTGS